MSTDRTIQYFLAANHLNDAQIAPISYGGNNRAFEIRKQEHTYFLKQYFHHPRDPRDRLHHEFSFSNFLWNQCGIRNIPQPLACDTDKHLGLYSFVQGRRLLSEEINEAYVTRCFDFFASANILNDTEYAMKLPKGSEASFTAEEHFASLEWRINRLLTLPLRNTLDQEAVEFVRENVVPTWKRLKTKVVDQLRGLGIEMNWRVPPDECCLSPSDFGFHNTILGIDGKLYFTDFEYAGWDDVAKMVNDFFCQPEIPAPYKYFNSFAESVVEILPRPEFHLERIRILRPLHILKWCCLLLNEFLPVAQNRRKFAGGSENFEEKKVQQLEKAQRMFRRLYLEEKITR